MYKETAEVIQVKDNKILLKVEKKAMCGCCKITSICNKNQGMFEAPANDLSLVKGDRVEIGIETQKALKAILLVFILPLSLFILSLAVFQAQGELLSFFLAISVMVLYYGITKLFLRKTKKFDLKVLRKINDEP